MNDIFRSMPCYGIAICLGLALLTTIGGTWLCVPLEHLLEPMDNSSLFRVSLNGSVGPIQMEIEDGHVGTFRLIVVEDFMQLFAEVEDSAIISIDEVPIPSWARSVWNCHVAMQGGLDMIDVPYVIEARGWPFLCLWCKPTLRTPYAYDPPMGGIELPIAWFNTTGEVVKPTLPLKPIWDGLLINLAIWTVAYWLVMHALYLFRRANRLYRGRCPQCGHQLDPTRAAGCPECGWNRPEGEGMDSAPDDEGGADAAPGPNSPSALSPSAPSTSAGTSPPSTHPADSG